MRATLSRALRILTPRPARAASGESKDTAAQYKLVSGAHAEQDKRIRIRAARLRLVTDKKQDKKTPDWVKMLADLPLD